MAFDFLGTIPSFEHFEELEEFVLVEATYIDKRIENLVAERKRHLELLDKFLQADVKLRSDHKKSLRPDRLWLIKARTRPLPRVTTLDSLNAGDVHILKKTFLDAIKSKRERNEFKIKRLRDLADQIQNEITFLTEMKGTYLNYLNKIRVRFDLDAFPENQRNKEQDQAEIQEGMTATPVDKGILVENGKTYYLITGINPQLGTISFDGQNPPLKEGDVIILSGGSNDGSKTVMRVRSDRSVVIKEPLVLETNSKSKAEIKV
jgi:hypothetical protein